MVKRSVLAVVFLAMAVGVSVGDDPIDVGQNPGTTISCTAKAVGSNVVEASGEFANYPFQSVSGASLKLYRITKDAEGKEVRTQVGPPKNFGWTPAVSGNKVSDVFGPPLHVLSKGDRAVTVFG